MSKFTKLPIEVDAVRLKDPVFIETLEGNMLARVGDWLVTGTHGEKYPVKHVIFIKTYIPTRMDIGYFPNTIIWTLYTWLHDVLHFDVTMDYVLGFVYICMVISLLILFYVALIYKKQDPVMLLKFILCAIMIIVLAYKVRSPQYVIWFTPLICILIADNIYKIGLFYITQILGYIEFPLAFGALWTNIEYTNPIYSTNWYLALILFTIEFSALLLLGWFTIEPVKIYKSVFTKTD